MLEALERGNLFVVPLDDKRHWYRYHHLFADLLQAHSREEQPDQVLTLHRRASEWYEQNGLLSQAIRHAFAAQDFERAADLVELAWQAMNRNYQSATLLGWLKALPEELIRARPVLSLGYAWASLSCGELETSEARLRDAERWLVSSADPNKSQEPPSARMVVVDQEAFRLLPLSIANARAYLAQALGDLPGTLKYAQQALDLLPEDDYFERGVAAALLGLTYWASGDLETADQTFADGLANMRKAGNILAAISGTFALAGIRLAQGRLREAVRTYEQSLRLATEQGERVLRGTADLYVGLSELRLEQGDLKAATEALLKSEQLGEQAALPKMQYRSRAVVEGRLKQAQGDLDGALDRLQQARAACISEVPFPTCVPLQR